MGDRGKVALVAAMVLFSLIPSQADAYKTSGDRSCGQWLIRSSNAFEQGAAQGWFMGYMTCMARATTNIDLLSPVDAPSIMAWVDNYCRANPLDKLSDAGVKLGSALIRRLR
ncbi:hypothetical protein [Caballeronia concitans]|uniref:hypothetical protein n=1 Tax=Caballeronia concitans TaxID=1777133 RepID=UPI000B356081|nr:hypothetical protein [Caballeronia concitans]